MTENWQEIKEAFIEKDIRAEKILHLGTQCLSDHIWPNDVQDAFFDDFDEVFTALDIDAPEEHSSEIDVLEECIRDNKRHGYLVLFATPIPTRFDEHSYSTRGWSYYTIQWIYSESYYQACEAAIIWHDEYIQKQRKVWINSQ